MMRRKRMAGIVVLAVWIGVVTGCGAVSGADLGRTQEDGGDREPGIEETEIALADEGVLVDGRKASADQGSAVFVGGELVYYEEGKDETYGEGEKAEEHAAPEADRHVVVTIAEPGRYRVSGSLSFGQIVVDLGKGAKKEEEAVVELVLDDAGLTCTVAPAILVKRVYECGSKDVDTAVSTVDTSKAGFRLILADDSENMVSGSHVAKRFKDGTTAEDVARGEAEKEYKYDAAITSRMSFNIEAESKGNGKLTVFGDKEGIETGLHLTVNGGEIAVNANDDSLNAGEDFVSVITVNGGILSCNSGYGNGKEGDGIDSNGWIVVNGGQVTACANAVSKDSGLDSELGAVLNGGTVLATGHMYDEVSADSSQNYMVIVTGEEIGKDELVMLAQQGESGDGGAPGRPFAAFSAENPYTAAVFSSDWLEKTDYGLFRVSSVEGRLQGRIYRDITEYENPVRIEYDSAGGKGETGGRVQ